MSHSALKEAGDLSYNHVESVQFPLCVDLDGTLINTDTMLEGVLVLLKKKPKLSFMLPLWLLRGRAYFKNQLAKNVTIDYSHLPYHQELIAYIKDEKKKGRKVILATGANNRIAQGVTDYLQIFDGYFASNSKQNLTGRNKQKLLVKLFGAKKYDYIGNSQTDIKVWNAAHQVLAANVSSSLKNKLQVRYKNPIVFSEAKKIDWQGFKKVLRPHQWSKNMLVFLPLFLANQTSLNSVLVGMLAFLAFCFSASAGYVFNDLLDIASDRKHEQKRFRPIASGQLSIGHAFMLIPILLSIGLTIGLFVGWYFTFLVLGYFLLSSIYTVVLKKIEIVDVITLSIFYTLRIYAGGEATHTLPSVWLIGFSSFFFFSLALIKRSAELVSGMKSGSEVTNSRGYELRDHNQLSILGSVSGFVSILVMGLYISSDKVMALYQHPHALWVHCLLLTYWISRLWMLTSRGQMLHDPVLFALKDKASLAVGFIMLIAWLFARGI